MNTLEYEFHPYASILPMMGPVELNELAADIQANGLRSPIVLLDGKILDGRNRFMACAMVSVKPEFRDFNGDGDPVDYIVSVNVKRRHLTASQRALVVAKVAQLPRGDISRITKSAKPPINSQSAQSAHWKTAEQAAKDANVSKRTVVQAKQVLREAPGETIEQVERGEKSVSTVVKEIRKSNEDKRVHLDKTGYPIPDEVYPDWCEAEAFRSTLNDFQRLKLLVEKAIDERLLIFREITNSTLANLRNACTELQQVLPYAVCPTCQGRIREKCTTCRQRGFISQFGYEHWIPKKTREIRERAANQK